MPLKSFFYLPPQGQVIGQSRSAAGEPTRRLRPDSRGIFGTTEVRDSSEQGEEGEPSTSRVLVVRREEQIRPFCILRLESVRLKTQTFKGCSSSLSSNFSRQKTLILIFMRISKRTCSGGAEKGKSQVRSNLWKNISKYTILQAVQMEFCRPSPSQPPPPPSTVTGARGLSHQQGRVRPKKLIDYYTY